MNGVTLNGSPQSGSDSDSDSDEFGEEPAAEVNGNPGADSSIEHRHKQASGAPQPLEPELVTLSLLPRSQWQSLVHLDAIKVGLLTAASCHCCLSLAVSPFEMADTARSSCFITCSTLYMVLLLEAVGLMVCACKAIFVALPTDLWPGLQPVCNQQLLFTHACHNFPIFPILDNAGMRGCVHTILPLSVLHESCIRVAKRFLTVEVHLNVPHAFVTLDFHCEMDISDPQWTFQD